MFDLASHAGVVARAADHMIRQHGRHAADFAAYRSRELRALGDTEAATLWAEVSRRIGDLQGAAARCPQLAD
jgi:hypothetical protein